MGLKYFNNRNSGDLDIAEVKYDSFGRVTGEFAVIGGNQTPAFGLSPGNGYIYHTFTSPGYLDVSFLSQDVEILLVGGGGGSGSWGGGGAGGLFYHNSLTLTKNVYTITIGSGGVGADVSSAAPGNDTTFVSPTLTATAKGGGAGSAGTGQGGSMGSVFGTPTGWGSWSPTDTAIQPTQPQPGVPAGYLQYGFKCGNGAYYSMGGGGGAGGAGPNATASWYTNGTNTPTPGGVGRQYPQFVGSLIGVPSLSPHNGYFGGGGGSGSGRDGWVNNAGTSIVGTGGLGGGGNGGAHNGGSAIDNHTAGSTNTGGGGGGASSFPQSLPGKSGGSGIVIIRYLSLV